MGQEQRGEGTGWVGRKGGGSGDVRFLVVPGIAPSGDAAEKSSWGSRVAVEVSSTIQRRGSWETPSGDTLSPPLLSIHEDAQTPHFPQGQLLTARSAGSIKSIHKRGIADFVGCKPQR